MNKNLKFKIKNSQLAKAVGLGQLKEKLAGKKNDSEAVEQPSKIVVETPKAKKASVVSKKEQKTQPEAKIIRAKSKSSFSGIEPSLNEENTCMPEDNLTEINISEVITEQEVVESINEVPEFVDPPVSVPCNVTPIIEPKEEVVVIEEKILEEPKEEKVQPVKEIIEEVILNETLPEQPVVSKINPKAEEIRDVPVKAQEQSVKPNIVEENKTSPKMKSQTDKQPIAFKMRGGVGPTGRHINDYLKKPLPPTNNKVDKQPEVKKPAIQATTTETKPKTEEKKFTADAPKKKAWKDFKDIKPANKKPGTTSTFGSSFGSRQGLLSDNSSDDKWRKRRYSKGRFSVEEAIPIVRPSSLKIPVPIALKDLAAEMKLKASELIQKLFLNGMVYTLNDLLDDETIIQYIGSEFNCDISIDRSESEKSKLIDNTIQEEILADDQDLLEHRAPVVVFMGHVDHGKTSLIDAIRQTNRVSGECGAITQHVAAFKCETSVGTITILDTPGHEAFSAMRARGSEICDIVVLVVSGEEGIKAQTIEAANHAKEAGIAIIVAINKCDKTGFDADTIYRQLAEIDLTPECWGGDIITINTSALKRIGIEDLLEMISIKAEMLELKSNRNKRARGTVIEVELHKGLGNIATILVQNGTLKLNDNIVLGTVRGRIKTIQDDTGKHITEAFASDCVTISGLSSLPVTGEAFITVDSEKEAKAIIEARISGNARKAANQKKKMAPDCVLQKGLDKKKVLNIVLRTDVHGSEEALTELLSGIKSEKAKAEIISSGVGQISESDIRLAAASNAIIIGFQTTLESHALPISKVLNVKVLMFNVVYDCVDKIKELMKKLLDKLEEERILGEADVVASFKSSQLGLIAGCMISSGFIQRNHKIKVVRDGSIIWKGSLSSIKREKEDVREVKKGFECGILLNGFNDIKVGDHLIAFETIYITQEL